MTNTRNGFMARLDRQTSANERAQREIQTLPCGHESSLEFEQHLERCMTHDGDYRQRWAMGPEEGMGITDRAMDALLDFIKADSEFMGHMAQFGTVAA